MNIAQAIMDGAKLVTVPIESIRSNPKNPRTDLGDLTELKDSIRARGIIQEPIVMPHPSIAGDYMLLAGHRRHAAAKQAGLLELDVKLTQPLTDEQQQAVILIENVHRSDLKPSEEAAGVQALFDLGLNTSQVSSSTGFSRTKVKSRAALSKLPEPKRADVDGGQIKMEDVASLEEFEKYPELHEKVVAALGTSWELARAKNEARSEIAWRENIDDITARFTQWGITCLPAEQAEQKGFTDFPGREDLDILPRTVPTALEFSQDDLPETLKEHPEKYAMILHADSHLLRWRKLKESTAAEAEAEAEEQARQELWRKASDLLEDERAIFMTRVNVLLTRPSEVKDFAQELLVECLLQHPAYDLDLLARLGVKSPRDFDRTENELRGLLKEQLMKKSVDQLALALFTRIVFDLYVARPASGYFSMEAFNPSTGVSRERVMQDIITGLLGYTYGAGAKAAKAYFEPALPGIEDEVNF